MPHVFSTELRSYGNTLRVHGLSTGTLALKDKVMNCTRPGNLRTLLSFVDKQWADFMPVWTWVIEHPEGTFLIDTGNTVTMTEPDHYRGQDFLSRHYFTKEMRFRIEREEEVDHLLEAVGLSANSVDRIVLTHLHSDHTGGLGHFPGTPVIVSDHEWETKDSAFPRLWPEATQFDPVALDGSFGPFPRARYLTEAEDLILVETPGHTRGHCSVLLKTDDGLICFAGDLVYDQERLFKNSFSATIQNEADNRESCRRLLRLADEQPVIFLSSHDAGNAERLNRRLALK
ncbi:glyoxylase-like metal-dependent hydrolase (beta-lactamase superfamily II) [Neolewinella xylanilytica]|uniref:Glyoxylase-like metal-dependent hydrolase (Beta-lactamase superfamily II) n=1 Tax=Neolewinella xylanilytica TaxID=1514080 RepID=A0A2S6I7A6_9BACT|nr:N-acyl homoserine lactonase family protein [Neolewinella xylanilytica]PPK87384.1 glyoxylase-like metal-dependent hydrolase (beta-lactamase superfamily II) [Neolewinella xylanilytica]